MIRTVSDHHLPRDARRRHPLYFKRRSVVRNDSPQGFSLAPLRALAGGTTLTVLWPVASAIASSTIVPHYQPARLLRWQLNHRRSLHEKAKAEGVRGVRTPVVVRPKANIPFWIGRLLFVIPAERLAVLFRRVFARGNSRRPVSMRAEVAPAPWFGITNTSKPASRIAFSSDVANTLSPCAPSRGKTTQAFAPATRAYPADALRTASFDLSFCPLRPSERYLGTLPVPLSQCVPHNKRPPGGGLSSG